MKIIYSDCICIEKNPSDIGGGYLLCDENSIVIKKKIFYRAPFTNNEAEFLGVAEAIKLIDSQGTIYTDSQNTINWLKRGSSKTRPDLNNLIEEAKENFLIKKLKIEWVERDKNLAGIIVEDNKLDKDIKKEETIKHDTDNRQEQVSIIFDTLINKYKDSSLKHNTPETSSPLLKENHIKRFKDEIEEDQIYNCPLCGERLVKRLSQFKNNQYWYGCSSYPNCNYSIKEWQLKNIQHPGKKKNKNRSKKRKKKKSRSFF